MYKSVWSRRSFLKKTSLLGSYLATTSATNQAAELATTQNPAINHKSSIGYWTKDKSDFPLFRYIAKPLKQSSVNDFKNPADLLEDDPYFLLGNYRLTSFVHSSGVVRLLSGERGWAKLNEGKDQRPENRAHMLVNGKEINLIGPEGLARDPSQCDREFGIGYASFFYPHTETHCRRTLSVAPSTELHKGVPAYLVEIVLTNTTQESQEIIYEETMLARYVSSMDRTLTEDQWPVQYIASIQQNTETALIICKFKAQPKDPSRHTPNDQANRNDMSPPGVFIQAPAELNPRLSTRVFTKDSDDSGKHLGIQISTRIAAGKSITAYFVIGTTNGVTDITPIIDAVITNKNHTKTISPFLSSWKKCLPEFTNEKNTALRAEMQWNAYVLESMAKYSEFYGETFVPQGMTYDYTIGLTAAPRDHLQHSLPLCYTNVALAKSTIRFVLKKMTYQGEIKYTDVGYGRTSNSAWNTSDQQLYLFLAVSEYLRISGDATFLEEQTEFLPMEAKYSATTLEKLRRAFSYLRDEVNVGPHGLIRLMNSDWNDMIFMDTPIMKHYWTAESHMNSAMGLCVIPALIAQLEKSRSKLNPDNQKRCKDLITGLQLFEQSNRDAFYKDFQDRTFSRRLYLSNNEALGDQDMHIEPQIFLMQDKKFPPAKKKILWNEIQKRLLDKELLEPRQREHGIPGAPYIPGTGENGGLWHALTGPLVIGLASIDKKAAMKLLERMTFNHFAKCYPDYWVGHWTSPDTINTFESGSIAGLPRNGDNGFWFNFAAYCAHSHAWPLYCYLRLQKDDANQT
jgi:hypothetical protein